MSELVFPLDQTIEVSTRQKIFRFVAVFLIPESAKETFPSGKFAKELFIGTPNEPMIGEPISILGQVWMPIGRVHHGTPYRSKEKKRHTTIYLQWMSGTDIQQYFDKLVSEMS